MAERGKQRYSVILIWLCVGGSMVNDNKVIADLPLWLKVAVLIINIFILATLTVTISLRVIEVWEFIVLLVCLSYVTICISYLSFIGVRMIRESCKIKRFKKFRRDRLFASHKREFGRLLNSVQKRYFEEECRINREFNELCTLAVDMLTKDSTVTQTIRSLRKSYSHQMDNLKNVFEISLGINNLKETIQTLITILKELDEIFTEFYEIINERELSSFRNCHSTDKTAFGSTRGTTYSTKFETIYTMNDLLYKNSRSFKARVRDEIEKMEDIFSD